MLTKILSATPYGIQAKIVTVEVAFNPGLPAMYIVGLPDTAIRESRERIRGCLRNIPSSKYPIGRFVVNLAPAALPKYGTQFDLAIAMGVLSMRQKFSTEIQCTVFLGELSLDGKISAVKGCLAMVLAAKSAGYASVAVPFENAHEAQIVIGMNVYAVQNIIECIELFTPGPKAERAKIAMQKIHEGIESVQTGEPRKDFKDIIGLEFAKRAMEIAAAGAHNLLLSGSPGIGKTLLAETLPSILPELDDNELLEVLTIHGMRIHHGIGDRVPPFRAPQPSVTRAAFIGGGNFVQPGEISLAHHGVLFMDEFPEFPRAIIESLRQPLESGTIAIQRAQGSFIFPARCMLVAAQNPCPCGNYGDVHTICTCSAMQLSQYRKKISGPIIDRIDINVRMQRGDTRSSSLKNESSSEILQRVFAARVIQKQRNPNGVLNAHLTHVDLQAIGCFSREAMNLLEAAENKFSMSRRSRIKVLKIARTIADIANVHDVSQEHLAEALRYRFGE